MEDKYLPNTISPHTFRELRDQYPSVVPDKLSELEEQRLRIVPSSLAERKVHSPSLTKSEVQTLTKWKLSHGAFRPSLMNLVAGNSDASIESTTTTAFLIYRDEAGEKGGNLKVVLAAIKELAKLRGIGPATASLLLNTYDPDNVPFFSDELFRWLHFEDAEKKGKGTGWERKIGYTIKEYEEVLVRMEGVRKRLEKEGDGEDKGGRAVSALDMELVAYVLGKTRRAGEAEKDTREEHAEKEHHVDKPKDGEAVGEQPARKRRRKA